MKANTRNQTVIPGRGAMQLATLMLAAWVLGGCAVNPVTGKNELAFVSTAEEIQIGQQQYEPMRQMGGGDYVVDAELTEYVAGVGNRLAAVSDRDLPYEFAVINDSTPNAWALPGGKIAIHRGLLVELGSEAELAAVLGHEIVHAAARHGAQSMQRGMLLQGAMVATSVAANASDYGSLLMTGAGIGAQLVNTKYGRDAERESDSYGMEYMSRAGYNPEAAVQLQETFLRLSGNRQSGWLDGLFASHPPSAERVRNNQAKAAELPSTGEYFRDRYQQATARIRASQSAYDAHDRGRRALAEGKLDIALNEAQQALRQEPDEALFHNLRGDIRSAQQRWSDATINYSRAIDRNPGYFYAHMRRGIAHKALGRTGEAVEDLQASIDRLPTAPAMNALGELRLAAGQRGEAMQLFAAAASSNSPDGRAAAVSLMRLELKDKPSKYLKARVGTDNSGRLLAEIQNPTPLPVTVKSVLFEYIDQAGQTRRVTRTLNSRLDAESSRRFAVDNAIASALRDLRSIRAGVSGAELAE